MIFISHRKADDSSARQLVDILKNKGVSSWLDVLDPSLPTAADITKHIVDGLDKCSHVIVLFSTNTAGSMWVPFELGAAYKSDKGIATYLLNDVSIPEYLYAFPRMKKTADLDLFIAEYKNTQPINKSLSEVRMDSADISVRYADTFINKMKTRLGQ